MLGSSGIVGVASDSVRTYEVLYLVLAAVFSLLGFAGFRWMSKIDSLPGQSKSIQSSALLSLVIFLGITYLAMWMSGAFGQLDDVWLEAVSSVTATNLTAVKSPESLERGILFLRAICQWIGGIGAFCFFGVVLPLFIRGREMREYGKQIGSSRIISTSLYGGVKSVIKIYLGASGLIIIGYLAAGLGIFDAVTHGFTTISTGGFSNYGDGLAHFNSAGVEWVAAWGMFIAGIRPALILWMMRGSPGVLWRSLEMRIYFLVLTVVTLFFVLGEGDGIRRSFFSTASAISGTGFYLENWAVYGFGLQVLLILLIATGTMSGTAGGGFGLTRAIEATRYLYRELVIQLHPRAVFKVKIGNQVVQEESLANTQSFQFLFLSALGMGAFLLAQTGASLIDAASGAVTAFSTMGPGIGDVFSEPSGITGLPRPARAVLTILMLAGRISIFPLMIWAYRSWERIQVKIHHRFGFR